MARKRTTRNGSEEGQVTIWLTPEEIFQLESICTIRMADSLAQICRGFIRDGMLQETQGILAHFAKVAERDQETDPSSSRKARDACGPVSEHAPARTQADFSAGLAEFNPPELRFIQLDPLPPELDKKGLRGGEADEESLKKEQGTERVNMQSALQGLIAAVPDQPQTNPTSVRPQGSKNTIA